MHSFKNRLLVVIACILWGSAFAGAKIGFEYTTPIHLSGMRFTLAGILLIPLLIYQKVDWRANLKEWKYMLSFGFIQTFMQYGLFFIGLNKVPASISAIIIGAGPLFIAIMAHFSISNDKLTKRKIAAIVLGMVGIIFVSLNKESNIAAYDSSFYVGILILIASNLVGSSTNIIVAKNRERVNPIFLTAFANFTGGILLYITSIFTEDWYIKDYTFEFYAAWIWLAIIPAGAFSIWYSLLKKPEVKVSELNIWKFLTPVSGVLLSWLLLSNETANLTSLLGIIIISIALITLQWPQKKKQNR